MRVVAAVVAVLLSGVATQCSSAKSPVSSPTTAPHTSPTTPTTPSSSVPGSPASTSSTSTTSTTQPVPTTTSLAVYFVRGNYLGVAHRSVAYTTSVGGAAVGALLGGPNAAERAEGLSSAVPSGSILLGLTVSAGRATVNLNSAYATAGTPSSELNRIAQVVFTLTQFPTVQTVNFQINGATPMTFASGAVDLTRALGRSDVLGALPAILVENPAVGDVLHGSLHLSGMANVYEAQFRVQLIDGSGHVLVDQPVMATAGTGTWGTFDTTYRFTATTASTATLRVYDLSAKDGTPQNEVDLHLTAGP